MKQNPLIRIFSISQNDAHGNCQCPDCARIDAEEGSPSGSLVRFVNTVAERLEKEYPDIRFDTLAYQYTRKSPAIVKPRRNVIIRLCSYECSFSQPLDSAANLAFADDLKAWAKIADNIYIWDYIANFGNFIRPHPNLRVLGPNLRFFAANRVKGIFEQGSYGMHSGEMEELRAWVLARLMWNPWQDDRALIEEFVTGYYGAAAPYVREYLKMTHDAVETNTFSLSCWSGDPAPHVTFDTMSKAAELFGKAEAAVADRPSLLVRVRRAHMPVQVMWLIHYPEWAAEAKTRGRPAPLPFATIFDAFKAQVQTNGVLYIAEGKNIGPWLEQIQAARVPVKVSGCFGGSMPWYFCDGDPKTGVALGGFGPQWVQRDLESIKKVKSIVTDFGSHYNEIRYRIEASADEVSWTAIVPDKILKGYVATDAFPTSVEARFIKTIILHAASVDAPNQWVSMAEQTISTE